MSQASETLPVARDLMLEGRVMEATAMMAEAVRGYGSTEEERFAYSLNKAIGLLAMPQVGQILMSSGGYEQTRCHFYQVIGVTPKSVKIVPIGKRCVEGGYGFPTDAKVMPVPLDYPVNPKAFKRENLMTKRVKYSDGDWGSGYSVSISDYSSAYLWDGTPGHESGDH